MNGRDSTRGSSGPRPACCPRHFTIIRPSTSRSSALRGVLGGRGLPACSARSVVSLNSIGPVPVCRPVRRSGRPRHRRPRRPTTRRLDALIGAFVLLWFHLGRLLLDLGGVSLGWSHGGGRNLRLDALGCAESSACGWRAVAEEVAEEVAAGRRRRLPLLSSVGMCAAGVSEQEGGSDGPSRARGVETRHRACPPASWRGERVNRVKHGCPVPPARPQKSETRRADLNKQSHIVNRPTGARDLPPYTRRSSLPTPSSGFSPGTKRKKPPARRAARSLPCWTGALLPCGSRNLGSSFGLSQRVSSSTAGIWRA